MGMLMQGKHRHQIHTYTGPSIDIGILVGHSWLSHRYGCHTYLSYHTYPTYAPTGLSHAYTRLQQVHRSMWIKGSLPNSTFHVGSVGINVEVPDEALCVHGNIR